MQAAGGPIAECVAVAKRDLRAGGVIDGIGGATVYATIDTAEHAAQSGAVPIGITAGARLRRDVPQGTELTAADVELDESLTIVRLRRRQEALSREGGLPLAEGVA